MDGADRLWLFMVLILSPVFSGAWREERRDPRDLREMRRPGVHYHSKRHMMISEPEPKKRSEKTTPKPVREIRKKPTGHLAPLHEDDIENDEVVSVAIGPPPMRPKFDKHRKISAKQTTPQQPNSTAVNLVREVLTQLGREFLTKDLNENFVFGQYVGNAMKNLSNDLKLKMQHDILDLIVKYQNLNSNDTSKTNEPVVKTDRIEKSDKVEKTDKVLAEKKFSTNETDDSWPDFTNLAKIVG